MVGDDESKTRRGIAAPVKKVWQARE